MKVKRELNRPPAPKIIPNDKLEQGTIYRSEEVVLNHATIFLAINNGEQVADVHTGRVYPANRCSMYVEVKGTLTVTGDVTE